jgi:hypothetical protein
MFKLSSDPKFTIPVEVFVPIDGGHRKDTFKATFRVGEADALNEFALLDGQREELRKIFVGFDEVLDEADNPIPYSDEMRDRMIATPYVRAALVQAYLGAIVKARAGN